MIADVFFRVSTKYWAYFDVRSRNALPTTDSELKLMAAAASMGLRSRPKKG